VAQLKEVDHELLLELDELVERCLETLGLQGTSVEGVRQVAEILNRLPANRQQMMEQLRARDPKVVSEIEVSMYDFFILSRQSEAVITRLLEQVPMEQWAIALKGAEPAVRNAVLQAMPRRQAQTFEDTLRRTGPMPRSRIEQAREEIMAEVKALVDAGEIEVQLFAEAVVE
jgi:flagellar motor switch protein FliG